MSLITGSGLDYWIYWHFFTITINYNSTESMTAKDSFHSTGLRVSSSTVTDSVLIYESVTSSASLLRW
jgi:hypothetical protein